MVDLKFHHIGIATSKKEGTVDFYEKIGFQSSGPLVDVKQEAEIVFLRKNEHPLIELVIPISKKSPVANIIKKGASLYHICYEVNNLEDSLKYFRASKFAIIVEPVEAIAFNNRKIAFVYGEQAGLIELLQSTYI